MQDLASLLLSCARLEHVPQERWLLRYLAEVRQRLGSYNPQVRPCSVSPCAGLRAAGPHAAQGHLLR